MHSAHGQVAGSVCRNRNLFLAWFRELNRANLDGRKAFDPPLNVRGSAHLSMRPIESTFSCKNMKQNEFTTL